jgi:hypothetical protein
MLTDPGFIYAERIGKDDLLQVFLIAGLGDGIPTLAIGKKSESHGFRSLGPL